MRRTYFAAAAAFEDPRRFLPLSVGERDREQLGGKLLSRLKKRGRNHVPGEEGLGVSRTNILALIVSLRAYELSCYFHKPGT